MSTKGIDDNNLIVEQDIYNEYLIMLMKLLYVYCFTYKLFTNIYVVFV